jgi:phosphoenolpyruvate carboxylase
VGSQPAEDQLAWGPRGVRSNRAQIAADGRRVLCASPQLEADERLLTDCLHEVVRVAHGEGTVLLLREVAGLGVAVRDGDEEAAARLAALCGGLGLEQAEVLVRALTRWFQLVNLAEDNDRVRRIRRRERLEEPAPRPGSMRQLVAALAGRGVDGAQLRRRLAEVELRLVITAHPTEARRRTTIEKLTRVFTVLRELDESPQARPELAREALLSAIQELWCSDELRAGELSVLDEVEAGLTHFSATLFDTVPALYRDLDQAVAEHFPGERLELGRLLTFGSWIGGDRDGNPHVTPAVTVRALDLMRARCLQLLGAQMDRLYRRLSLSSRLSESPALAPLLRDGAESFPELASRLAARVPEEPYRHAVSYVRERLSAAAQGAPGGYESTQALLEDLRLIERSLLAGGQEFIARGDLRQVICQVQVFGLHLARLEVREHAQAHRQALSEIYRELEICRDYHALGEERRIALLADSIASRRPLIPAEISGFTPQTGRTIETFRTLRSLLAGPHREAIESYIISGACTPSDLLEVLLLMKEASLACAGGTGTMLRIVPLFETRQTLEHAARTMRRVLREPVYRAALSATGDEQEVMIGYSDSCKDTGYLASSWAAYSAQKQLAATFEAFGVKWSFFHGRGGAVGRGGGPTNAAIRALPPGTIGRRLKMTEQGEVATAKYALREIAHRELELAASATLVSGLQAPAAELVRFEQVMGEMADHSAALYRQTVYDDPDFARFFYAVTPIEEIGRLRLGSRPASRGPGLMEITQLRAIPWVFAWTQARITLPGWFGLGTALAAARERHGIALLRRMAAGWPFFQTLISNAEMALAKADPLIASRYVELWEDPAARRIWGTLRAELERSERELLTVRDRSRLLDAEPSLQASIQRRNPLVDPLSFIQIELLRRLRSVPQDARPEDLERLRRLSLLTINGIASALRNTG